MKQGSHQHGEDPRNRDILIYVNGDICPRERAVVSVFDSGFILGDGVWEGLRVHGGRIPPSSSVHLDRLYEGAKAIDLDIGLDRARADARRSTARCAPTHDRRRARAADGHPRHEEHALPGSARDASGPRPW